MGCGFRLMTVKGGEYVYFWHYEERGGRSRQVYAYMGPRSEVRSWKRLGDAVEAYYARAADRLRRDLAHHREAIAARRA